MKTAHTPGPWLAVPPVDEKGNLIAIDLFQPEYWFISGPGADVHGHMTQADARLIAAAPDLLTELQNIANCDMSKWDADFRNGDDFKLWAQSRARAAIAKATGGAA